jgi:hypothetical protein
MILLPPFAARLEAGEEVEDRDQPVLPRSSLRTSVRVLVLDVVADAGTS